MDRLIAIFVILVGINFLLDNFGLGLFDIGDLTKLWPIALIWVGVTMWREAERKKDWPASQEKRCRPPVWEPARSLVDRGVSRTCRSPSTGSACAWDSSGARRPAICRRTPPPAPAD